MKDYGKTQTQEKEEIKQEVLTHYTDSLRTYKQAMDALSRGGDKGIVALLGHNASFSHQKVLDLIRTPPGGDYKYLMAKKLIDVLDGVTAYVESKGDTISGFEIKRITPTELFYIKTGFDQRKFEARIKEEETNFNETTELERAIKRCDAIKPDIEHAKEGIKLILSDKKEGKLDPKYRAISVPDDPTLYFKTLDEKPKIKPEMLVRDKALIQLRLMIDPLDTFASELNKEGIGVILGERDPLFKLGIDRYNDSLPKNSDKNGH